jgi:hypothetical protein
MPQKDKSGWRIPLVVQGVLALIGFLVVIVVITFVFSAQDEKSDAPNGNIIIFSPQQNSEVDNVFAVSGVARVPDNHFYWEVSDTAGTVVIKGSADAQTAAPGMFGYYSFPITLPETYDQQFFNLTLYDTNADGARENTIRIPLDRTKEAARAITVYFTNNMLNPQAIDCSVVFPVYRTIPDTSGIARLALEELFEGPTAEEQQYGFSTSIPPGVKINYLSLTAGTLRADFSKELEAGVAGSCYVLSLRSQLTKTLEQFPSVMHATLSIEGRTQDILQP